MQPVPLCVFDRGDLPEAIDTRSAEIGALQSRWHRAEGRILGIGPQSPESPIPLKPPDRLRNRFFARPLVPQR